MKCRGSTPVSARVLFLQRCRVAPADDLRRHLAHTADELPRERRLPKPQGHLTLV
jgi:hypothetical protein